MLNTIFSVILTTIFIYEIFKGNLAVAIFCAAIIWVDYQTWVRGGKSILFTDKTQIEKDLRKIQKLEITKKLKNLLDEKNK